jgi:hypothetical protein
VSVYVITDRADKLGRRILAGFSEQRDADEFCDCASGEPTWEELACSLLIKSMKKV